ncbi:hypothetical protein [Kribbella sp. NBC_00359]|uniref:hypothetical protein n=1 Tax=Kribbella sp. NBC_00359 TaxID=2975966 RepID=UPI002E1FF57A
MTHLAATAITTAATHLMRAGQWTAATDLLRATQPDDPAEHRALALARAEVAVDQDFAQQTDHAAAALTALTHLLHDSTDPTLTWDTELLHLRKAYGTELTHTAEPPAATGANEAHVVGSPNSDDAGAASPDSRHDGGGEGPVGRDQAVADGSDDHDDAIVVSPAGRDRTTATAQAGRAEHVRDQAVAVGSDGGDDAGVAGPDGWHDVGGVGPRDCDQVVAVGPDGGDGSGGVRSAGRGRAAGAGLGGWAERLRDEAPDDGRRGMASFYAGVIADNLQGAPEAAFVHFAAALELGEKSGDELLASLALRHLGDHAHTAGDLVLAREQWERSTELRQKVGHLLGALAQQALLAVLLRDEGDLAGSRVLATEVNRWSRQVELPFLVSQTDALLK